MRIAGNSAGLKQSDTHLFSSGRQARISSNPPLDVEVALTVATQVDGTRRDVDVHQVVDNSALDVIEDAVHQVATSHVHDLDVGQIPGERTERSQEVPDGSRVVCSPVQNFIQGLIGRLVTLDPLHKVLDGLF